MDHPIDHNDNHYMDDDVGRPERRRRFSIGEAIGRIYKDEPHPAHQEHVKKLGDYIRFSNEGKPTKAEQLKRVLIKLYEASGYKHIPELETESSSHSEVIGTINDQPNSKQTKKGLEVSLVNGQIVLDRSSINRQVDRFDMNDSDEDLSDLAERTSSYRKHKVVVWSVQETKQFYECLRRFGTDFFMMNKVITNRTRRELKNKYKTEEKRNPRLVNMSLAVHLKEKMIVPEVVKPKETPEPEPEPESVADSEPQPQLQLPDIEEDEDEDELSESSDLDSDDGMRVGDLL